jgi:hypothetical protein
MCIFLNFTNVGELIQFYDLMFIVTRVPMTMKFGSLHTTSIEEYIVIIQIVILSYC